MQDLNCFWTRNEHDKNPSILRRDNGVKTASMIILSCREAPQNYQDGWRVCERTF